MNGHNARRVVAKHRLANALPSFCFFILVISVSRQYPYDLIGAVARRHIARDSHDLVLGQRVSRIQELSKGAPGGGPNHYGSGHQAVIVDGAELRIHPLKEYGIDGDGTDALVGQPSIRIGSGGDPLRHDKLDNRKFLRLPVV